MKERLKELRKKLGLKQREVAERLGVKVGQVGSWECGRENVPDSRIRLLCKEYNVRREWLETGEGEMFEPEKAPRSADEILAEAAEALFNELSPRGQEAVLKALRERVAKEEAERAHGDVKTATVSNVRGDVNIRQ